MARRGVLHIASRPDSFRQKPHEPARQPQMSSTTFQSPEHRLHLAFAVGTLAIRSSIAPHRWDSRQGIDGENSAALDLERELLEIERRLGTPAERPNDLERARAVAHKLANLICVALLLQGIASSQSQADDCSRARFSPALSETACSGDRGWQDPVAVACG